MAFDCGASARMLTLPPKISWRDVTQADLKSMDLRCFLNGRHPYGEHNTPLDYAFKLGKPLMEEIVSERVGFKNGRVLDLLAGFGRWLPFLAEVNDEVVAIERLEDCTKLARNMCAHFGISNVEVMTGDVSRIERFEDCSFDHVWLWSGLQYIERAYALTQVRRILRPGGRLFVSNYNATGLMVEHVWKAAQQGSVFDGASKWALSGLARGPQFDGNPNFIDPEGCAELCERFNLRLVASAPDRMLDLRLPDGRLPDWQSGAKAGAYFLTIEFVAERPVDGGSAKRTAAASQSLRRMVRRLTRR
jgi:SAM-dependent methyltransferase